MRMKTRKALNKGRVAKALLVFSFTVFLFLGAGMASAIPPGRGGHVKDGPCGPDDDTTPCGNPICKAWHNAKGPPFCLGHPRYKEHGVSNKDAAMCLKNCLPFRIIPPSS